MSFDIEFAKLGIMLFNGIATLAVAIYTYVATRDKDNSQHIKAVETALTKAIGDHASRLERVEMQMRYMPSPQAFSDLQGDMQAMQATQEAMQRDTQAARLSLNRIEDFLMKK
jgi:hypothetical protein